MQKFGVIGGSGLYELESISNVEYLDIDTPWGKPSDQLIKGNIDDTELFFLARHGRGHKIMPSNINFRANIYAFKSLSVNKIISISAVGSMKEEIEPGHLVVPDQFIDHTKKRDSTFFDEDFVAHISMANPVCPQLCKDIYTASIDAGATVHKNKTYICIEGPQFSTRAESNLYRSWDVDIIGMTNMPEAKLAREAEICYATLALSTDYDCWHQGHDDVVVEYIIEILNKNVLLAKKVLLNLIKIESDSSSCLCNEALSNSIITDRNFISEKAKKKYGLLIEKYI